MHCDVKIFYGSLLYEKIGADFTVWENIIK